MKYQSALEIVRNTPLINIEGIYAKLETTNPTGSIKDRMAHFIINEAERRGELKRGSKIIEVTTGNTGIAFAMICSVKGYEFTAIMPEHMSIERRKMMEAFGAKIILTPKEENIIGAVRKYDEIVSKNPDAWLPRQFQNPDNIKAHELGTGPEILKDLPGIDAFVAGMGTGGTLIGVGRALKKTNPKVKVFGIEPFESAVLNGKEPGFHNIQGIGEGFVPKIIDDNRDLIDDVLMVKTEDAIKMAKMLAKKHGLLVGTSSGANMLAALELKKRFKTVATILPDRGERYLS